MRPTNLHRFPHNPAHELAAAYEREHIAYELHDTLSQKLFSINLMVETLTRLADQQPDHIQPLLTELNQTTQETQAVLRVLMGTIQPGTATPPDLTARLRELVQAFEREFQTTIEVASIGQTTYVDSVEHAVYRIAQTALRLAFQQRAAHQAHLSLVRNPNCVTLILKDDGQSNVMTKSAEIMLMRARAAAIGGVLRTRALAQGGRVTKLIWRSGA